MTNETLPIPMLFVRGHFYSDSRRDSSTFSTIVSFRPSSFLLRYRAEHAGQVWKKTRDQQTQTLVHMAEIKTNARSTIIEIGDYGQPYKLSTTSRNGQGDAELITTEIKKVEDDDNTWWVITNETFINGAWKNSSFCHVIDATSNNVVGARSYYLMDNSIVLRDALEAHNWPVTFEISE